MTVALNSEKTKVTCDAVYGQNLTKSACVELPVGESHLFQFYVASGVYFHTATLSARYSVILYVETVVYVHARPNHNL